MAVNNPKKTETNFPAKIWFGVINERTVANQENKGAIPTLSGPANFSTIGFEDKLH